MRSLTNSDSMRLERKYRLLKRIWNKGLKDPHFFLFGNDKLHGFVWTINEHAKMEESPKQRLPDKAYLREVVDLWQDNRLLLIFKSRQMMITWLFCALYIWKCLHPGKRVLHVCKKEEDAIANLERMWAIYTFLPEKLKPRAEKKSNRITIHHKDGDSYIQAASQTTNDARQFTFSDVWCDEMAFSPNIDEIHAAAIPTIQGGGSFVGTSTPNGREYMFTLATDNGRIAFNEINRPFNAHLAPIPPKAGEEELDSADSLTHPTPEQDTPVLGRLLPTAPAPTNYPAGQRPLEAAATN